MRTRLHAVSFTPSAAASSSSAAAAVQPHTQQLILQQRARELQQRAAGACATTAGAYHVAQLTDLITHAICRAGELPPPQLSFLRWHTSRVRAMLSTAAATASALM